jgi:hypothetical protein
MNTDILPTIGFSQNGINFQPLVMNQNSSWLDDYSVNLLFDLSSFSTQENYGITLKLIEGQDQIGNVLSNYTLISELDIDTRKPEIINATPSHYLIDDQVIIDNSFQIEIDFSESMKISYKPIVSFYQGINPIVEISYNIFDSYWADTNTFIALFDFTVNTLDLIDLNFHVAGAIDSLNNVQDNFISDNLIDVNYTISSNSISEENMNFGFNIYPNPIQNGDNLIINNTSESNIVTYIVDPTGRIVVGERTCDSKECKRELSVISTGVYYLIIKLEDGVVYSEKFIVYE